MAAAGSVLSLIVTVAPTSLSPHAPAPRFCSFFSFPMHLLLRPLLRLHSVHVLRHEDFTTSTATTSDRQSLLSDTLDTRRSIAPLAVVDDDTPPGDGTSSSLPYHRMDDDEESG